MKVYKYRGVATLDRDVSSLISNTFYAPTAERLNDPTEAVLNDILVSKLAESIGSNVHTPLKTLTNMRHTVGIYSLSKTYDDELLWAHYAESHQGYCIEYDLERLTLEARALWDIVEVIYSDVPPALTLEHLIITEGHSNIVEKLSGVKSKRWAYEDEIRIVTTQSGLNNYAQASVTGIYFGCRCSDATKMTLRNSLRDRNIKYYDMLYPNLSYQLDSRAIEYNPSFDGRYQPASAHLEDGAITKIEDLGTYSFLYPKLLAAVEIVQRDPSCSKIIYADVSRSGPHEGQIFVQFVSSVENALYSTVNWYFDGSSL